jgi:hypothetical protein
MRRLSLALVLALAAPPIALAHAPIASRSSAIVAPYAGHRTHRGPAPRRGAVLRQGYETYTGAPFQGIEETICVPAAEALRDSLVFVHPDLGPAYLCRRLMR